jgi:hypothetical protein
MLLLTTVFSFGIITGMTYVWAESVVGKSVPGTMSQMGRYSIAVSGGGDAYIVDTFTGCVWRASKLDFTVDPRLPAVPYHGAFRLVSVEGVVEVIRPDSSEKGSSGATSSTTTVLPQKCIKQ